MIRWGKTRRSFSSRRVGKSGALDPSAGYALYLPFSAASPTYRSGATTYTDPTVLPGWTYSRSGSKQELLASGAGVSAVFSANVAAIIPGSGYYSRVAVTNLLLNAGQSSSLSTQGVVVTAQAYVLSFLGTGTVTLSGASTAGPLVGTGANNRVSLTFTPTAGTVTFTVTGSVTYSSFVAGLNIGPIIATAGASAATGIDFLKVTPPSMAVDHDFYIIAIGTVDAADGANPNRLIMLRNAAVSQFVAVNFPGTNVTSSDGTSVTLGAVPYGSGRHVAVLRRKAGKWTGSVKVPAGTVFTSVDTASAWGITGADTLDVAGYNAAQSYNGPLELLAVNEVTLSDAALASLMAAS